MRSFCYIPARPRPPPSFDASEWTWITAQVNGAETADGRLIEAAFVDENEPVGATVDYTSQAFSMGVVILPATIEGGTASQDEAIYAMWFMYELDSLGKGSRIGAIIGVPFGRPRRHQR